MLRELLPGVYFSERTTVLEGEEYLFLVEPGYDVVVRGNKGENSLEEFLSLAQKTQKEIHYITFSHSHGDHTGNLPFYLKRISFLKYLIGHTESPIFERLLEIRLIGKDQVLGIHEDRTLPLDGHEYRLLCTPGHSFHNDDMTVYCVDKKILFVGDLAQPQGLSYERGDGVSPVPFFYHGEDYLASLEKLLSIDFDLLITGHGEILDKTNGMKFLSVTHQTVKRIKELSLEMAEKHPGEFDATLCEWVYDAVVEERNYDRGRAEHRKKRETSYYKSDYEEYDAPGIKFFVYQARHSSNG